MSAERQSRQRLGGWAERSRTPGSAGVDWFAGHAERTQTIHRAHRPLNARAVLIHAYGYIAYVRIIRMRIS